MITVEIAVAASDKQYEFHLDESVPLHILLEEIGAMICQKEQCSPEQCGGLLLCDVKSGRILSPEQSLYTAGILTGDSLLLV